MTLSPNYFVTSDVDTFFIDKDTGLPLANGTLTFYRDSARNEPKPVFELSGSPPDYTYISMGAQITLSAVGTVQDSGGNNEVIYYLPFDDEGNLDLYYVVGADQNGVVQFTREAWPNNAPSLIPPIPPPTPVGGEESSSFLVGWDFVYNPFQFGISGTITTTNSYITDQTIAQVSASPVSWSKVLNGISFTTGNSVDAFYLMQYLRDDPVKRMLGTPMSTNVFGFQNGSGNPVTMTIYLFSAPSTAVIPTLPVSIGSISPNGTFTLVQSGWDPIPRAGFDVPVATLSQVINPQDINDGNNDYGFSEWQITDPIQLANTYQFAMVVTFAYSGVTTITIPSISLVPGNVPSRPAVKSHDEVLRQCQYYYENSFGLTSGVPNPTTYKDVKMQYPCKYVDLPPSPGLQLELFPTSFSFDLKTIKRAPPNLVFYAPSTGATGVVEPHIYYPGGSNYVGSAPVSGNWNQLNTTSVSNIIMTPISGAVILFSTVSPFTPIRETFIYYHYSADARLGIV